ncbi:restriction alleviation protein, Lar family, partial [Escherichia coli]|nr:restriction alleviation protein, Lar family [Escherichia coli]
GEGEPAGAAAAEKWNRRAGDEANLSASKRSNQK